MPFFFGSADHNEAKELIEKHHYSCRMAGDVQHIFCMRSPGGLFGDSGPAVAVATYSIPASRFLVPTWKPWQKEGARIGVTVITISKTGQRKWRQQAR